MRKPTAALRSAARLLLPALVPLLAPSCAVAVLGAGAGAGYVVHQELSGEGTLEADVSADVDKVWAAARESMDVLHDLKTEVTSQDYPRQVYGVVDKSEVWVDVEAYDLDRTTLRVRARNTVGPDAAVARKVLDDIVKRL